MSDGKSKLLAGAILVIVILVAGGLFVWLQGERTVLALPPLQVVGDVQNPLNLENVDQTGIETETLQVDDRSVQAVPFEDLLDEAVPSSTSQTLLLVGHDGRSASMCNRNLSESFIGISESHGWEAINFNHPRSANIKQLAEVVVIAEGKQHGSSFNIIDSTANLLNTSVGQLHRQDYTKSSDHVGTSTQQYGGNELEVRSFNRYKVPKINDVLDDMDFDEYLLVGRQGEMESGKQAGQFILNPSSISYRADGNPVIDDVRGLIMDPPEKKITDVYHDSIRLLEQGKQIMAVLVDGLGYHQYLHVTENGYAPFLSSLPRAEKALAVYPPVTPVNFAASVTGKTPEETGIHSRRQRSPQVPTIFEHTLQNDLKAAAIMGPIQVIDLEINPVLCVDENDDGSTDDEILQTALDYTGEDYDFLMVHFKDVDRAGHNYGDLADETLQQITKIDEYLQQLTDAWDGHIIVFSDHGMHETEEGGSHGLFKNEDMLIPYWVFDGGDYGE